MAHWNRRTRGDRRLRAHLHEAQSRATIAHQAPDGHARTTILTQTPAAVCAGKYGLSSTELRAAQLQRAIDRAIQAAVIELATMTQHDTDPAVVTPGKTSCEVIEGPGFDREDLSAYLAIQAETMAAVLKQAYLLIHEGKLSREHGLVPLLQAIASAGEPLLAAARSHANPPRTHSCVRIDAGSAQREASLFAGRVGGLGLHRPAVVEPLG